MQVLLQQEYLQKQLVFVLRGLYYQMLELLEVEKLVVNGKLLQLLPLLLRQPALILSVMMS